MEREHISLDSAIDLLAEKVAERVRDPAQKIGRKEFPRFLEAAETSNIPEEFFNAASLVYLEVNESTPSEESQEIAFRLVQKRFPATEQAEYAVTWGKAISLVKIFSKLYNSVHQTERDLPDELKEAREALLELKKKECSALKERVEAICGQAVIIEEKVKGPKKWGGRRIKHLVAARLRQTTSPQDLANVRLYLEEYFSKPENCSRIILLAQPRKR